MKRNLMNNYFFARLSGEKGEREVAFSVLHGFSDFVPRKILRLGCNKLYHTSKVKFLSGTTRDPKEKFCCVIVTRL